MKEIKKLIFAIILTIPMFFIFAFMGVYILWMMLFFDPYDDDSDFGLEIIDKIKQLLCK